MADKRAQDDLRDILEKYGEALGREAAKHTPPPANNGRFISWIIAVFTAASLGLGATVFQTSRDVSTLTNAVTESNKRADRIDDRLRYLERRRKEDASFLMPGDRQ